MKNSWRSKELVWKVLFCFCFAVLALCFLGIAGCFPPSEQKEQPSDCQDYETRCGPFDGGITDETFGKTEVLYECLKGQWWPWQNCAITFEDGVCETISSPLEDPEDPDPWEAECAEPPETDSDTDTDSDSDTDTDTDTDTGSDAGADASIDSGADAG